MKTPSTCMLWKDYLERTIVMLESIQFKILGNPTIWHAASEIDIRFCGEFLAEMLKQS